MDSPSDVLVADDDVGLADLYAVWLTEEHDVTTAYSGADALDVVDERTDVVFLDRRMPGVSGDEALSEIRDRGLDCCVAMVTGVNAGFDVIEMPLDAYFPKPVSKADLLGAVERLRRRADYDDAVREYCSLASKRAVLEAEKLPEELEENEAYRALVTELAAIERDVDALGERLHEADAETFRPG